MSSDRLIISAPLPPSSNHLYTNGRDGRRHLSKEAREYKKTVQDLMLVQGARKRCPEPPFAFYLHLRLPDRRRSDLTNRIKLIEDSVFDFLGHDDSLVYDAHQFKYIDRENPGIAVEIRHTARALEATA